MFGHIPNVLQAWHRCLSSSFVGALTGRTIQSSCSNSPQAGSESALTSHIRAVASKLPLSCSFRGQDNHAPQRTELHYSLLPSATDTFKSPSLGGPKVRSARLWVLCSQRPELSTNSSSLRAQHTRPGILSTRGSLPAPWASSGHEMLIGTKYFDVVYVQDLDSRSYNLLALRQHENLRSAWQTFSRGRNMRMETLMCTFQRPGVPYPYAW